MNSRTHIFTVRVLSFLLSLNSSVLARNVEILYKQLSPEEFQQLKTAEGVYVAGKNYNVLVDGHGTGLRPPTEEEWEQIRRKPVKAEKMLFAEAAVPTKHDNSATNWFPPIGNQGSEGSCVTWAIGYYAHTFVEAKEHDWSLSGSAWSGGAYGQPTSSFQSKIFSPDFIYHQINDGEDNGSSYVDAMNLLQRIGCSTWDKMPNNPTNSTAWPTEAAWRQAPLYRSLTGYNVMLSKTDAEITNLKQWLVNGNLAIISVNADKFQDFTASDLWTLDNYNPNTRNHVTAIVGYDDAFGPYSEGGQANKYGAFKVVNSWGVGGWEHVADGFYYVSYECMKQRIQGFYFYDNWVGYEPSMISVFKISHERRGECKVKVDVGPAQSPKTSKRFDDFYYNGGDHPYPTNKMVLDVTEFEPFITGPTDSLFLGLYDGGTSTTGIVNSFSIERYTNYSSGSPSEIYSSSETPMNTSQLAWAYARASLAGELHVEPTEIDLGVQQAGYAFSTTFLIRNDGGSSISGSVSESATWISFLDPNAFDLPAGESITIDCSGNFPSTPGEFKTAITISYDDGGDQSLIIKGAVQASDLPSPILSNPTPEAQGFGETTILSWKSATGAESYDLQLDDDSNFSSPIVNETKIADTRYAAGGLSFSQVYYWRVRSRKSGSVGEWSAPHSFTTMIRPSAEVIAPANYCLAYLWSGDEYYTDRSYEIKSIPGKLSGLLWIKSANDDQYDTGEALLSLQLNATATVYVAYDSRATSVPNWLSAEFAQTGDAIEVTDKAGTLLVWSRQLAPGAYTFGGNLASGAVGAKCNYVVLIDCAPQLLDPVADKKGEGTNLWLHWQECYDATSYTLQIDDDSTFVSPEFIRERITDTRCQVTGLAQATRYFWRVRAQASSGTGDWSEPQRFTTMANPPAQVLAPKEYVFSYLQEGEEYYIDRGYTLGSIPADLDSLLWLKTANDDQANTSDALISVQLEKETEVYVAYDHRATSVPYWLSSQFVRTDYAIEVADKSSPLIVWRRNAIPGALTLGGNQAPGASGSKSNYAVMLKPLPPPLPDLEIANLSIPHTIHNVGGTDTVSVTVKRSNGQLVGDEKVTVQIFASVDNTLTLDDLKIGESAPDALSIDSLSTRGSQTVKIAVNLPSEAGNYFSGAIVDPLGVIQESEENNNRLLDSVLRIGHIAVTYPDSGGIQWQSGSNQSIAWSGENIDGPVRIDLLKGILSVAVIADSTVNDGSYSLTVPSAWAEASDYRVKISDARTGRVSDLSDSSFSIITPPLPDLQVASVSFAHSVQQVGAIDSVSVTVRRSGGYLSGDHEVKVWLYASLDNKITTKDLKIGESSAGAFVATDLNDKGTLTAVLSAALPGEPGDYYLGAMVDPNGAYHESKEGNNSRPGPVAHLGKLSITYPDSAGITWQMGQSKTIRWTSANVSGKVKIVLLKSGMAVSVLADSTDNDGDHEIMLPETLAQGSDYTVKIQDAQTGRISDGSDHPFNILLPPPLPDLKILALNCPNEVQNVAAAETVSVTLTRSGGTLAGNGSVPVALYTSLNTVIDEEDAQVGESANGDFPIAGLNDAGAKTANVSIKLPSAPGNYYLAGLVDPANSYPESDEGNNHFTGSLIRVGRITITHLDSGQIAWQKGSSQVINWSNENVVGRVRIQMYQADTLFTNLADSTENDGSFDFIVSANWPEGSDYKIKVCDANTQRVFDWSKAALSITAESLPDLRVTGISISNPVLNVGASTTVSVTAVRTGSELTGSDGNVDVWLYASQDTIIDAGDLIIGKSETDAFTSKTLNSLGTQSGAIAVVMPSIAGDYHIGAMIDPEGRYAEAQEGNNSFAGAILHVGRLTVTYPDSAGIVWQKGQRYTITWKSENVSGNVQLNIIRSDSAIRMITASTANDGDHTFIVPVTLPDGNDYQVWIADALTQQISDIGDAAFSVETAPEKPKAEFAGQPLSGAAPLEVHFQDESTGNVSSWRWNFGDSSISILQNPSHVFEKAGQYSISLKIDGPGGSDLLVKEGYVNVTEPLPPVTISLPTIQALAGDGVWIPAIVSDLTGRGVKTYSATFYYPDTVMQFIAASVETTLSQAWGAPAIVEKPDTLEIIGSGASELVGSGSLLRLSFLVKGNAGQTIPLGFSSFSLNGGNVSSSTKPGALTILERVEPPQAAFSASPLDGKLPLLVQFKDESIGKIDTWLWRFGDGQASSDQSPAHIYEKSGIYSPSLTVTNAAGRDSLKKDFLISVSDTVVSTVVINRLDQYGMVTDYSLSEGYPNPFNGVVRVNFSLPETNYAELSVLDRLGRELKIMYRGSCPTGSYQAMWDGRDSAGETMPSGIYFICFRAGEYRQVVRVALVR